MKFLISTALLCLIAGMCYSQVSAPTALAPYQGVKKVNEVADRNGIISNATYPDNILTKEYKRYQADSTRHVEDSLLYIKLKQIAPVKYKRDQKK